MTDKPTPHPMAVGGNRPKPTGRGRPPKEGRRHPGGQLVQKVEPNPKVLAAWQALCRDPRMATRPLDAAFANGWLSPADYYTAVDYAETHAKADLLSPGSRPREDYTTSTDADGIKVNGEDWSSLTNAQIAAMNWHELARLKVMGRIWDNAFSHTGEEGGKDGSSRRASAAMRRWKQMSSAMTASQRVEVDAVCLRDAWPQWILERAQGRMETHHEVKRTLLIQGLEAIRVTKRGPRPKNDNAFIPAPEPANDARPALIEIGQVEDDKGRLFVVERRHRTDPAA